MSETNNPDGLTEAQRTEIREIIREEQSTDSTPMTRRDALKVGGVAGLLGLAGASGTASADSASFGGTLNVDDSYQIAGSLYAGPASAKPANPSTNGQAIWWVTDAQTGYVMRKEYWTGSSWETIGIDTDSVHTERLGTASRAADYVIHKDNGTIYGDGPNGTVASGDDASTVIQAVLDDVPEYVASDNQGGAKIHISEGRYELTSTLEISRVCSIIGGGRAGQAYMFADPSLSGPMLTWTDTGDESNAWTHLERLYWDGNRANRTDSAPLIDTNNGGSTPNTDYQVWRDMYVMRSPGEGVRLRSQDNHIYNVYVEFCAGNGWDMRPGQNGQFYSCTAWDNDGFGVEMVTGGSRVSFYGCRFMKNGKSGLILRSDTPSTSVQLTNCYINENDEHGVRGYDLKNHKIADCEIRDNNQAGSGNSGIYFNLSSENIHIHDCDIYTTSGETFSASDYDHGILIEGTPTDNNIHDNYYAGIANADVSVPSNETIVNGIVEASANAEQPQQTDYHVLPVYVDFTDTGDGSGDGVYLIDRKQNVNGPI